MLQSILKALLVLDSRCIVFFFTSFVCYLYNLKFPLNVFISDILAKHAFLLCHNFSFWRRIQSSVKRVVEHICENSWQLLAVDCFIKSFTKDVQQGSKYASAFYIFLTNQSSSFHARLYFGSTQFLGFPQESFFPLSYRLNNIYFSKFSLGNIITIFVMLQILDVADFTIHRYD